MADHVKYCNKCKQTKPRIEFYSRLGVSGDSSYCQECSKALARATRQTPEGRAAKRADSKRRGKVYRERINSYTRLRRRTWKWEAVQGHGNKCHDCKGTFPLEVYDFHHLDPQQKDNLVSRYKTKAPFLEEMTKCVLLCANCHRIRHIKADFLS